LVGHPPFPEGTLPERILKHQTEEPKDIAEDRPDTPSELIRICRKMMAKEPDDRFQTADEVAKVLSEWHPSQAKILKAAPLEEAEAEAEAVEDEVTAEAAPAAKARPAARKRAKESLAAHLLGRAKGWVDYVMADRRRMMIWGGSAGAVVVVIVCGLLLAMVLAVRSARKEQQQVAAKQAAAQKEIKSKSAKDGDFDDFKFKWEEAGPDKPAAEKTATDTTATSSPPPKPGGPPPKPGGPPPKPGAPPPPPGQAPPAAAPAAKTAPPDAKAAPAPAPAAPKSMPAAAPSPPTAPAEKSAKPAVPAKPAEEKKPPAATPKPATPPPAAPAPATPADAFAGFPTFVELPPLPDPDAGEFAGGPTLLGKVHGALDTPVSIELLGKDTALKGRRHFTFEQKDNDEKQQSWIVRIDVPGKEKEDGPADVALLIRDKDGLKFRWADKTPAAVADYLRNCALELRGGGPAHIVGLRKVAIVEPIFFDLQKGISTANVPIEFMPDAANLRVEFTKVEGQAGPLKVERMEKALFNPAGPITPKTPASLSIARKDLRGHQIKGVDFAIMTAVKGKGLTITVRLTYPSAQMYKAGLKSLDANRIDIDQKIRGLPQQFAAAKKEEEKAKIADDFEKKGGEPLWYEDFYKQVHRNGQLHFRVFIEAKDQQIELARTEMPK
jgi:hypothetical protein